MTKIVRNKSLLEYQQEMDQAVRELIRDRFIGGVRALESVEPPLAQVNLLPPPVIHLLDLDIYDGWIDDIILLSITEDFGIHSVLISIQDQQGCQSERGRALNANDFFGTWCYFTKVAVPPGTQVTVRAVATDCLGGVGVIQENKFLTESVS